MTAAATLMVPIETELARGSAIIHDVMNNVLNFETMIKAGAIKGAAPGVMTGSHVTLTRIIVLRAMLSGSQVILSGISALHATLMVLAGPLTRLSGLVRKILVGRAARRRSGAALIRINSISTSWHHKMSSLKGTTNVSIDRSSKDARRIDLTAGVRLLTGSDPRRKNGMSLAYPMDVFSRDLARYSVERPSSGRE